MRFRLAHFELDAERFELRRRGRPVALEPKPLQLLLLLAQAPEHALSVSDLRRALWPKVSVGVGSLHRAVNAARAALGDARGEMIRTVRGHGYRIGVPVEIAASAPLASPPDDPFVGRDAVLELLERALRRATEGAGAIALLAGEPGIGKTRTAVELEGRARALGARVLWGSSWRVGAPPYWPWREALRSYVSERPPEALRAELGASAPELSELVPEIREGLPDLPDPPRLSPEQARFRLFDGVAGFLHRACSSEPWLVILDDLHDADAPSVLLLRFLARELHGVRLLVLGAYRDTEVGRKHRLRHALDDLRRAPGFAQHTLAPLQRREAQTLVARLAPRSLPGKLAGAIVRRADGNPFFLRELVRYRWEMDSRADETSVPRSVRQAIHRRLERLSGTSRRLLTLAAVAGTPCTTRLLAPAAGARTVRLRASLEEAERAGLVSLHSSGSAHELRFAHDLVRDAILAALPASQRARLHRALGTSLERLPGGVPDAEAGRAAACFVAAGTPRDLAKGVAYSVQAARHATASLAFEEAAHHYRRALEALARHGRADGERCEILLALAEAEARAGRPREVREIRSEALSLARRRGLWEAFSRAAVRGRPWSGLVSEETLARRRNLEEALTRLPAHDTELRACVLAALSATLYWTREQKLREARLAEALAMGRRLGPQALLAVHRALGGTQVGADAAPRGAREEWLRLARELGDGESEVLVRSFRLAQCIEQAQPEAIEVELEACHALAEALRHPRARFDVASARAARAIWRGELAEGERRMGEALRLGARFDELTASVTEMVQRCQLRRVQGRLGEIVGLADLALDHFGAAASGYRSASLWLWLQLGRRDEARAAFEAASAADFEDLPRDANYTTSLGFLAEACAAFRDAPRAERLHALLEPYAGRYVAIYVSFTNGCVSRPLALLAACLGRHQEASRRFEEALAVERRMEARPWIAFTQLDFARFLLERGRAGDAADAQARLDEVSSLARELGLPHLEEQARRLRQGPPPSRLHLVRESPRRKRARAPRTPAPTPVSES